MTDMCEEYARSEHAKREIAREAIIKLGGTITGNYIVVKHPNGRNVFSIDISATAPEHWLSEFLRLVFENGLRAGRFEKLNEFRRALELEEE